MTTASHSATPRLRLAQAAWLLLVGLTLVLYVVGLPPYLALLQTPCVGPTCVVGQVPGHTLDALARLGLGPGAYALGYAVLNLLVTGISAGIGLLIFVRRPDDWAAWTTSLLLVLLPSGNVLQLLPNAHALWVFPAQLIGWITAVDLGLVFYTFPDGRFVPRWTQSLAVILAILMALENFSTRLAALMAQSTLFGLVGSLFIASLAMAQVVRYRRVSSATQRQQTKWVVVGTVIGLGLFLAYTLPAELIPRLRAPGSLFPAGRLLVQIGFMLIVAASIGIAILRHRLWDIDLLINRALVYASLTLALTLVYFGSVIIFQTLLSLVSGPGNTLASVAATLTLAALFRPLRARIQAAIDRRFYRRKYNADQVAAAFGALLRDEVDLDRATAALVAVVADTLEPRQVWLWLPGGRPKR